MLGAVSSLVSTCWLWQRVRRVTQTRRETTGKAVPREHALKRRKRRSSPCKDVRMDFTLNTQSKRYKYILIGGRTAALPKHVLKTKPEEVARWVRSPAGVSLLRIPSTVCKLPGDRGACWKVGGWASVSSIAHVGAAPESPFPGRTKDGSWVSTPKIHFFPISVLGSLFLYQRKYSYVSFSHILVTERCFSCRLFSSPLMSE